MEQPSFAIEPEMISLPRLNMKVPAVTIVETFPNGDERRHRTNDAGDPFRTEAEAQLWIMERSRKE
jgi:hypothetical protein